MLQSFSLLIFTIFCDTCCILRKPLLYMHFSTYFHVLVNPVPGVPRVKAQTSAQECPRSDLGSANIVQQDNWQKCLEVSWVSPGQCPLEAYQAAV